MGGSKSGEVRGRSLEARPHPGPLLRGEGERDPVGWADLCPWFHIGYLDKDSDKNRPSFSRHRGLNCLK